MAQRREGKGELMATLTKQELFSGAMLSYMTELKGGKLKKFCETMTQEGGETITFNRLKKATAKDGVVTMFGAGANADGGDMEAFKATIAPISAQMKITEMDMNKTKIDIKNGYVKSLGNAVSRKEDSSVISAVVAAVPKATHTIAAGYKTEADIRVLISAIRQAQALAAETPDGHNGVALVMSPTNWADLSSSDFLINGDYLNAFGSSPDGSVKTFYGAEVCLIDDANIGDATNHTSLVIPSNTVCFGEWEGSQRGDAIFYPTDGMKWHLQAYKSIGTVVAEAASIFRVGKA